MTSKTSTPVAAFATLGGAKVIMSRLAAPASDRLNHMWKCTGCTLSDLDDTLRRTVAAANEHAGMCRSTQLTD